MKVAEASALWELKNLSIVIGKCLTCSHDYVDTGFLCCWTSLLSNTSVNTHIDITYRTPLAFATSAGSCYWFCVCVFFNW